MDESKPESDGLIRVQFTLEGDISKKFLADCATEEREMSAQARFIIKKHYQRLEAEEKFAEIQRLQKSQSGRRIPHFGASEQDLQHDVSA